MTGSPRRVLITGMGVVSSIGCSLDAFEESLRSGRSGITAISEPLAPGTRVQAAAVLRDFSWSDWIADQPTLTPPDRARLRKILNNTTDSTRWSVIAALQAVQGMTAAAEPSMNARRAVLVAGNNLSQAYIHRNHERLLTGSGRINPKYAVSFLDTNQLGCITEALRWQGGSGWTTGGASASGNVALYQAWQLIRSGALDQCLVVGAGFEFSPLEVEAFSVLGAASTRTVDPERAQEVCRPFDEGHSGFVRGEGSAALLLESETSPGQRADAALGEIPGASVVLDGTHLPEPSESGETAAMRAAIEAAGLKPEEIEYVNAHGSGSPLGDRTECAAIERVFGADAAVRINATKALTGHCISASAILEAVACVLQMRGRFLHPNINLARPIHRRLRFAGRQAESIQARHALSNAFGFGGINSSILIRVRPPHEQRVEPTDRN